MKINEIIEFYKSKKPIINKNNENIVVMSFNIRCINKNDKDNKFWKVRMPYIRRVLKEENPDIVGFQEVRVRQFDYLKKILADYDYEYTKRDEKPDGEANPVFYKINRFSLLAKNTFWLSDTPDVMSNSFNNACYRICSFVYLKENTSNKLFAVFNTHLDHKNEEARVKSIKLIKKTIKELNIQTIPHLIIGDMNDFYNSNTINELFSNYIDASKLNNNDEITFHNYGLEKQKIDYIALTKSIKQLDYKVIKNKYNNIYPSDHYPIEVVIKI